MSDESRRAYYDQWYEECGDELNARRRRRYASDPAYREKVLDWSRGAREAKRKQTGEERKRITQFRKMVQSESTWKAVDVEVDGRTVKMFTVGALARALGRSVSTIRVWERSGVIPETPYRSDRGDRLYPMSAVEKIRDVLVNRGKLEVGGIREKRGTSFVLKQVRLGSGDVLKMRLYKVSVLALAIERTSNAVLQMERLGRLPRTPLVASKIKYRIYTLDMIEVVRRAYLRRSSSIRGAEWGEFFEEVEEGWTVLGVMDAEVIG